MQMLIKSGLIKVQIAKAVDKSLKAVSLSQITSVYTTDINCYFLVEKL